MGELTFGIVNLGAVMDNLCLQALHESWSICCLVQSRPVEIGSSFSTTARTAEVGKGWQEETAHKKGFTGVVPNSEGKLTL